MKVRHNLKPWGIIDIGSNSIRLCVYDGATRTPIPLFNEKAVCALAHGLGASGRLNPDGIEPALAAIGRFVTLARAMEVERLDVLATAAVRDAADGPDFVDLLLRRHGVPARILSGGDEAELAAWGVLCGTPDADGIVADLGGGSLELVTVGGGLTGRHVTMPLGLLRLAEDSGDDRARAEQIVDKHLKKINWLRRRANPNLYAVGGAWRALARLFIAQTQHPLTVLDNFALDYATALDITQLVGSQSRKSLEKVAGVARKRAGSLPLAAQILHQILKAAEPSRLVFSVYGMREGRFFQNLPKRVRSQDPLLSLCRHLERSQARFPEHGDELMAWMAPLFPGETAHDARIRHAACLVSDAFWGEHPDYRAEQAFLRILRLPFMGVPHADRAAIALTVLIRYQGDEAGELAQGATHLMDEAAQRRCRIAGSALRLAHTLSGGAPNLLRKTRLRIDGNQLVLTVPASNPAMVLDQDRNFDRLARELNCDALVLRPKG